MALTHPDPPSAFGTVLRQCRHAAKLPYDAFASELLRQNFPSFLYSGAAAQSTADQAWLAKTIEQIENSRLNDPWPFSDDATEFIDPAARALAVVFEVLRRLTWAMALDELARADP